MPKDIRGNTVTKGDKVKLMSDEYTLASTSSIISAGMVGSVLYIEEDGTAIVRYTFLPLPLIAMHPTAALMVRREDE